MCGRYVITKPISKTKELVKSTIVVNEVDNYNAHPTQKLPVIKSYSNGKTLEMLQWGLTPPWVQEKNIKPLINARLETLGEKMSFKNLIINYRCLVVADGYYEWKRQENVNTPYYFTREDNQPMFFAGIYKDHQFLIITNEASSDVANIHQRQPVIINKDDLDKNYKYHLQPSGKLRLEIALNPPYIFLKHHQNSEAHIEKNFCSCHQRIAPYIFPQLF